MKDFKYEQAVESLSQIIKNDILNIMNKQKKFSAFDIDEILNVFIIIIIIILQLWYMQSKTMTLT